MKIQFAFFVLVAAFVCATGCAGLGHHPDPLAGWKLLTTGEARQLSQSLKDDCQKYIHTLPSDEQNGLTEYSLWYYEDGMGQHAVKFTVPVKAFIGDILWDHILIYDKDNKRIEAMKFKNGRALN